MYFQYFKNHILCNNDVKFRLHHEMYKEQIVSKLSRGENKQAREFKEPIFESLSQHLTTHNYKL